LLIFLTINSVITRYFAHP